MRVDDYNGRFQIAPVPRLYVGVADGCPACAAAKPALERLKAENPLSLLVIYLHLDRREWDVLGWSPNATPAYALVVDGKLVRKHVGTLTHKQLIAWLRGGGK